MEEAMKQGITLLTTYGLKIIGALLIFIVGRLVAGWVQKNVANWLGRSGKVEETLKGFLSNFETSRSSVTHRPTI